jgi:small subunit ribosomal protein S6
MKSNNPNLYEGMFILGPNLTDESRMQLLEKVRHGITSKGGQIEKEHDMGRRKLASKVLKHSEGYYALIYFTLAPDAMNEFWRELRLMKESGLLRFMTMRTDEILEKLEFKQIAHS